jgi:hypothetical protein
MKSAIPGVIVLPEIMNYRLNDCMKNFSKIIQIIKPSVW